jgi:hypothetical protein
MILKGGGIKKWLAMVAGVLLILGAIIYGNKIGVSADDNDTDFLANIQDKPDLNDPTIIRLPEKYSRDDVQKAVNNLAQISTKSLSSKDKEISDYIRMQENKIAKNLPLKSGTKDKPVMNDLVFRVADSKSQFITPTLANNKAATKVVEDNFEFDPTVTEVEKNMMIQAYPVIESIYGPRQNTRKITVFKNINLGRAWYSGNHIELENHTSKDTAIHELVHAFRGYRTLNSLWEEGSAVFITTYVEKQMNLPTDELNGTLWGYEMNYENLPSTYNSDIWGNAWGSSTPYNYGSMILDKIAMEDIGFFKKFNQRLFSAANSPSRATVLKMAIASISTIEGESSAKWFSHQYPYLEYFNLNAPGTELYYSDIADTIQKGYYCWGEAECDFNFSINTSYDISSADFDVRFLDSNKNVLVDSSDFESRRYSTKKIYKTYKQLADGYKKYQGLIYVEVTPTSNPSNQQLFSFLKSDDKEFGSNDVFIYSKIGNIAVFERSDGSNRTAVEKTNDYFSLGADWINLAGKYKVTIYNKKAKCTSANLLDCLGIKRDEKYFNKAEMGDYYTFYLKLEEKNDCGIAISDIKPLNRSISLNSTTNNKCGQVISLNNAPIYRFWGTSFQPVMTGLVRDKIYKYQINYASDTSKILSKSGRVRTGNYLDFRLLKSQSFGDPLNNNFYQRLTFSSAYDPASLNFTLPMPSDSFDSQFTIKQVSDKVLDIIPSHTYNNYNYQINSLNMVKDTHGNPLFSFDWRLASFHTPMNPLGAENPTFTLGKEIYSPNDQIIISKNFISRELTDRLSEISLFREPEKGECQPDSITCGRVELSVSIVNDQIVIIPQQPMISGKNYWISLPIVVDDSNNIVFDDYDYGGGQFLGFRVN